MNITIRITYTSRGIRTEQAGTFPSKKRTPVKVAADWILEIKKKMDVDEILKIEANGVDITNSIIEVE